ncbi:MAG TPA: L,D-transpeptidase family protein [Blastocatellia bacterium]|nr:L,D-transpeptidase family protein [Blastocatellia bacterium]
MNLSILSAAAVLVLGLALQRASDQSFKAEQMKFDRVRAAIAEKEPAIKRLFAQKRLSYPPKQIFIRVFKREQAVELWVSEADPDTFELLKEYKVCASSGTVGPKREQGDDQVPEGFYRIDRFNPLSNFHLSLGVNYPNQADKMLGVKGRLGGDIFIHGNCVTIGCVPITDESIKELYVIAVEARSAGQTSIPIHIFPAKLHEKGLKRLEREFGNPKLLEFWMSLKPGYDFFEKNRRLPIITIDRQGRYQVKG